MLGFSTRRQWRPGRMEARLEVFEHGINMCTASDDLQNLCLSTYIADSSLFEDNGPGSRE